MGSIDNGKRNILNRDRETKAVDESRTFFSSESTNDANDTRETCTKQTQTIIPKQDGFARTHGTLASNCLHLSLFHCSWHTL